MGAWADIIKVLRSTIFKNELKNGDYSVKHATSATSAGKLSALGSAINNVFRHVWFSDDADSGLPRKDDNFKYNPSTNTLSVPYIEGQIKNSVISSSITCQFILGEDASTGIVMPSGKTYDDITMIQLIGGGLQPLRMFGFRRAGTEILNFNLDGMYTYGAYTKLATLECSFDVSSQNKIKIYTHKYYETTLKENGNTIRKLDAQNGDYEELFYAYVILYFR